MRYWEALEAHKRFRVTNAENAAQLSERFERNGAKAEFDAPTACMRVNGLSISFTVARWRPPNSHDPEPVWVLNCEMGAPEGWIIALRLGENNRKIQDHLLLPSTSMEGTWLRFIEKTRERRKIERFATFEDLAQSLVRRVKKVTRDVPKKRPRSKAIVFRSGSGRRSLLK